MSKDDAKLKIRHRARNSLQYQHIMSDELSDREMGSQVLSVFAQLFLDLIFPFPWSQTNNRKPINGDSALVRGGFYWSDVKAAIHFVWSKLVINFDTPKTRFGGDPDGALIGA
ncbi:MAG: hypothetical protein ACI97A_002261 [Planctomycetota bacterium]|jgi:hypothetical protein